MKNVIVWAFGISLLTIFASGCGHSHNCKSMIAKVTHEQVEART